MLRKPFAFMSLLVVCILLVTSAGASAAPLPPTQAPPPQRMHIPADTRLPAGQPANEDGAVGEQAIALGKPGTVFAFNRTFGESEVPYFEDFTHIYTPNGVAFDSTGALYVAEEKGARLLKFRSINSGTNPGELIWRIGKAGIHDWGQTGVSWPRGVTLAPDENSVWVADNEIISQFDAATGDLIQHFPPDPGNVTDDNLRFYEVRGIRFDSEGHMYVSDQQRGRIQVFSFDGDGIPVYEQTISGFESPVQIVMDTGDILYVADLFDHTVKKCVPNKTSWPWSWSCSVYFGVSGEWADDSNADTHLGLDWGLGINRSNHVLYIPDAMRGRLLRCPLTSDPVICTTIVSGLGWIADVAVDPTDSTLTLSVNSWNGIYRFYGEDHPAGPQTGDPRTPWISNDPAHTPYITDAIHFNQPFGVDLDKSGNLYILEHDGQRMTKLNANGVNLWSRGQAGIGSNEDTSKMNNPNAIAVDKRNIVIVGGGGNQLRTYDALTGAYKDTLDQGGGDGLYQFGDVVGVATDSSNYIYTSDGQFNRIRVYSYNPTSLTQKFTYVRQVGLGGDCGSANNQFCNPRGIFVDTAKNLYVADQNNCRVQKFDSKGNFVKTFGTQLCGRTPDRMGGPTDVAVDSSGRVYVAMEWSNRVNVYDKYGAYLTTIAGSWDSNTGGLRQARAIALDAKGAVYVADSINSRIQKYTPGVPYMAQLNLNGFGQNGDFELSAIGTFQGKLYAGTSNWWGRGAKLWRQGTSGWEMVIPDGLEDSNNIMISALQEYKGYLYLSTLYATWDPNAGGRAGQVWRSDDGLTWQPVTQDAFGTGDMIAFRMGILGGKLCVSTLTSDTDTESASLYCSTSGDPGSWTADFDGSAQAPGQRAVIGMLDYKGYQYISTARQQDPNAAIPQIWRRQGTGAFALVDTHTITGSGDTISGFDNMVIYNGDMFVGVAGLLPADGGVGVYVWHCKVCDGSDWNMVSPLNFFDPTSSEIVLTVAGKNLFAVVGNRQEGDRIWKATPDTRPGFLGEFVWTRMANDGFGDNNNHTETWTGPVLSYKNNLYIGIKNWSKGGSLWKFCPTGVVCR